MIANYKKANLLLFMFPSVLFTKFVFQVNVLSVIWTLVNLIPLVRNYCSLRWNKIRGMSTHPETWCTRNTRISYRTAPLQSPMCITHVQIHLWEQSATKNRSLSFLPLHELLCFISYIYFSHIGWAMLHSIAILLIIQ